MNSTHKNLKSEYNMTQIHKEKQKGLAERLFRYLPFLLALILWCILAFKDRVFSMKNKKRTC